MAALNKNCFLCEDYAEDGENMCKGCRSQADLDRGFVDTTEDIYISDTEVAATIKGYREYLVTNLGRVIRRDTMEETKYTYESSSPGRPKRKLARLYYEGERTSNLSVANLVASCFLKGYTRNMTIRFKDGDNMNLDVDNLYQKPGKNNPHRIGKKTKP